MSYSFLQQATLLRTFGIFLILQKLPSIKDGQEETSPLRRRLRQNILKGPRNCFDTWDKEDQGGKEIEHTRGAKSVSGDARINNMANKTENICG